MEKRPLIGISIGDVNGIGIEIIIKTLSDHRILELCIPVIFGNNKVFNFYRKGLGEQNLTFSSGKDFSKINPKQYNLYNSWDEEVTVTPGQLNENGGKYAILSLTTAGQALKNGDIAGLVTAPIHKKNTHVPGFDFTGHTPYLKNLFDAKDVVMMMVASNMRVGLVTEHVPLSEVAPLITKEIILNKIRIIHQSLKKDFGINNPKIAVLGLNPHAGDEGLLGKEEEEIILPAIKEAKNKKVLCFGPFSADAFFARGSYQKFDAVLAMYHDQGLIPFKSLANGEGVNFTAGLDGVRTSPDHGVAFDIAGKGIADESSFRQALYTCIDIIAARAEFAEEYKNPLKKMGASIVANSVDEKLTD